MNMRFQNGTRTSFHFGPRKSDWHWKSLWKSLVRGAVSDDRPYRDLEVAGSRSGSRWKSCWKSALEVVLKVTLEITGNHYRISREGISSSNKF